MSAINQLSAVSSLNASDLIAVWSSPNGDARKASMTVLAQAMQSLAGAPKNGMLTQYIAPNTTGFSVLINPIQSGQNVYLLMTPTGAFAAGTITLPFLSTAADGQEVLVTSTQAVTALTVNGNGAVAVNGAPTGLSDNGFFRLRYDGITQSWYRIG